MGTKNKRLQNIKIKGDVMMKQGIIRYTAVYDGLREFVISNRTNTGGIRRIFELDGMKDMTIELDQQEYRDYVEENKDKMVKWDGNSIYNMETLEEYLGYIIDKERVEMEMEECNRSIENPKVGFFSKHKGKIIVGFALAFVAGFVGHRVYSNYTNVVDLEIDDVDLLNIDNL